MASDDQWPPVSYASGGKGSAKFNGNRRFVKESQQETLKKLNEMFSTTVESEIILSVAQNCSWELQRSIEALIELTETVENPQVWKDTALKTERISSMPGENVESEFSEIDSTIIGTNDRLPYTKKNVSSLRISQDTELLQMSEKAKKGSRKNRMDSFCGNIAKLKSYRENTAPDERDRSSEKIEEKLESPVLGEHDPFFSSAILKSVSYCDIPEIRDSYKAEKPTASPLREKKNGNSPKGRGNNSSKKKTIDPDKWRTVDAARSYSGRKQKVACFDSNVNVRKNESESLCGLKVQYRLSGMESSSDDDADVVIEDESSDYAINLTSAITNNVSQFLSPPTQTPPRRTRPQITMINTPSPPRTPQRSIHDTTFARIKACVLRGDPILVLLRGLPGSGKTTLAKSIISATIGGNPSLYIYSTDDFFMNLGRGAYKFEPTKLSDAHASNQSKVSRAMREGRTPIIVDNTNIEAWEMRPYAAMAVGNGYIVEILEPNTPWARNPKELAERNTHNVTKAKIRERASRYDVVTSGKALLDMYRLRYTTRDEIPNVITSKGTRNRDELRQERMNSCMADIKSNWGNHDKNNYVLTSHDIESMQNIDETHNPGSTLRERSDSSDKYGGRKCPQNLPNYEEKVFNDYLQTLQNSDDESFEMLESSGSEILTDIGKTLDIVGSSDSQDCDENTKSTIVEANETSSMMDSNAHQIFGAIGSERKFNHAAAAAASDEATKKNIDNSGNVLSQCWDFTLIREGYELHSRHGHYVSPFAIVKKLDDATAAVNSNESEANLDETDIETDAIKQQETVIQEKSDLGNVSANEVDDNVHEIEIPNERNLIELNDDIEMKKHETLEQDTGCTDTEDDTLHDLTEALIPCSESRPEDVVDTAKETLDSKIRNEKKSDVVTENSTRTTLGSLLHVIKRSILGGSDEPTSTVYEDTENKEDLERFVSYESARSQDSNDEKLSIQMQEPVRKMEEIAESEAGSMNLKTVESSETVLAVTNEDIVTPPSIATEQTPIPDENDEIVEDRSTKLVSEETTTSQSDARGESSTNLTDNINRVSWKESPFPVDGTKIPIVTVPEDDEEVSKVDAQTMTTIYDFNVVYVGGTSEPEYRELWGVSRSINEDTTSVRTVGKRPPKTMFDKSSMTGEIDILATETSSAEKEKDSTNRLERLMEMFPHYPRDYLKTLYEQQCNCNFDWVVDVLLLADVPNLTIENYEKKATSPVASNDDGSIAHNATTSRADNEKAKQRSHSSSPRNRRNRTKDFRCFSLDCVEDYQSSEVSFINEANVDGWKEDENKTHDCLNAKALSGVDLSGAQNDLGETSATFTASGSSNDANDQNTAEILELNFGFEFINQLESICGNPDFVLPGEFKPVIRIKKSMVEELYGLWIQSMNDQMNVLHAQLDERMAKDEAMARAMDREETIKLSEPVVPNFDEIMSMEMALAKYQNELKENVSRETPNDMASRLTRQMLYDLLPDIDKQLLSDILKAHGGNFKETCEIIEASIGRTITKTDTLRKQQSLLEKVNEERKHRDTEVNLENTRSSVIVVNPDIRVTEKSEKTHHQEAIRRAQEARIEAQRQVSLRVENYNKAAEAYRKGQPQVAAYYSEMVKLHKENENAAHAYAASEFLAAQMYAQCGEDTLDLHNLHVREALGALDEFLDFQFKKLNKSNRRSATLFIITGHGARSSNGLGKLKPAVSKKLISKHIRFTEANLGCLRITLNRKNSMFD